jgi:DNA-directed RNA polymerase specialized sigma24 family protein
MTKAVSNVLDNAIKKLDAEERALISLFYNEEKTIGEIALILGLTESNAKVKLHRIRKKLYILITEAEASSRAFSKSFFNAFTSGSSFLGSSLETAF